MQPEKKKGAEKGTHNTGNPRRLQRSKRDQIRSSIIKRHQKSQTFKIRAAKENKANRIPNMYLLQNKDDVTRQAMYLLRTFVTRLRKVYTSRTLLAI